MGAYKTLVIFEKLTNKGIALDFISKDCIDNPYKTYNLMRSHKPILFSQTTRLHWVTKMEFAQEMLRDKRFSVDDRKYPIADKRRKEFKKAFLNSFLRLSAMGYFRSSTLNLLSLNISCANSIFVTQCNLVV